MHVFFIQVHLQYLKPLGFENLQKAFAKAKNVIEKEGKTPTFFVRCLVEIEDFIAQVGGVGHGMQAKSAGACIWQS